MTDKIFASGLWANKPQASAPDYIICGLSIEVTEFADFMQAHADDGKLRVTVKESKSGKWYAELDTWKPQPKADPPAPADPGTDPSLPF